MKNQILKQGKYTGKIEEKVSINGGIITRTHYAGNSNPHWHYHENLHIVFVSHNGLSQTKRTSVYTDHKGQIATFRAGEVHRYLSDESISKSANIELSPKFLKKYDLQEEEIFSNIFHQKMTKSMMLNIQAELIKKNMGYKENLLTLLLELVSSKESISLHKPQWILLLKELLNDNWNQDLSLEELSSTLGIHPVTISKNFRRYFGCTLGQYKRKLRIEKSIDFIKNEDWTLTEIAYHCGFSDQSHFIKNFKEQTNLLPNFYKSF